MTKFEGMQEQINTTVNALQEVEGEKKKNFLIKRMTSIKIGREDPTCR